MSCAQRFAKGLEACLWQSILGSMSPSIILISAGPGSGKTNLIKYILCDLFSKKKLFYGIVFCPTSFNDSYSFLPSKYIYSQYDEDVVINLINLQIKQIKSNNQAKPCFIVFDDMIGSINFNSHLFSKLVSTFRHYNVTLIFSVQYLYKVSPVLRECVSLFITFYQPTKRSIEAIYDTYMNEFESYNECKEFIQNQTKDYKFIMVITNEKPENKYVISCAPLMNKTNFKINY